MVRSLRASLLALVACSAPASPPRTATPAPRPATPPFQAAPPDAAVAQIAVDDTPKLRLPRPFLPSGYTIALTVDPAQPKFTGHAEITGTVRERTHVIWLHSKGLDYTSVRAPGTPAMTRPADDLVALRFDPPVEPGPLTIQLDYTGSIDPINTAGLFAQTVNGASYAYTQLESLYARRVFPCIDEPDVKVPWQLTLDVPKGNLAVSNTSVVRESDVGALHRYEFAPTKPLPSYLVAFGVGPFDVVDAGATKSGVPVRMITLRGRKPDAAFAAKTTARVLELVEEYFGTSYAYGKLDLLTIPIAVGFGAMENAGLVTVSEDVMLLDPASSGWAQRRLFIADASHELAHQWFGDLVTMAWWDDLWLNEAFANWLENKIVDRYEPAWHSEQVELDHRHSALDADAIVSARRIRQPIAEVADIERAFDSITYSKGASVIAMFESFIGAETFQRGVRAYVHDRAHGNATTADFVGAIATAAKNPDLTAAFSTFLDQPGAPLVTMSIACDKAGARVELGQTRYVPPGSSPPAAQSPWQFPVCVANDRAGKRGSACTMLTVPTGTLALAKQACPRWVMPNAHGRGYYRVQYTAAQIKALRDEAWDVLEPTERRTVFFDVAAAIVRARDDGRVPLLLVLSFVPKLLAQADRFMIADALRVPLSVYRFVPDKLAEKYAYYMRTTFGPGAARLGVLPGPTDTLDDEQSRSQLLQAAAWYGRDPDLVATIVDQAKRWRELPAGVRPLVLQIAVDADADVAARILRDVKTETDRRRRSEMIEALASVRDPKRYEAALALVFDPALDLRETMGMLVSTSTEATRQVAERFVRGHEAKLLAGMPKDSVTGLSGWLTSVFTASCDASKREEAGRYALEHYGSLPGGQAVIRQKLEQMDQCIARRELLAPEVRGWLSGIKIPRAAKR